MLNNINNNLVSDLAILIESVLLKTFEEKFVNQAPFRLTGCVNHFPSSPKLQKSGNLHLRNGLNKLLIYALQIWYNILCTDYFQFNYSVRGGWLSVAQWYTEGPDLSVEWDRHMEVILMKLSCN